MTVTEATTISAPAFTVEVAYDPATPEWQEVHRSGIGSSDAAAALGLSPYVSPYTLYLEKADQFDRARDEYAEELMYWGTALEPVVATRFFAEHPEIWETTSEPPVTVRSTVHPFMLASLDREIAAPKLGKGALEIKCTGAFLAADWSNGVPDDVTLQVLHQLVVTGYQWAWVAVLIGGNRYLDFFIDRADHEATIAGMIDREAAFWQLVTDGTPPAIDGSSSTRDSIRQLVGESVPESEIELPAEALVLRAKRDSGKRARDEMAAIVTRYENEFAALMGTNETGLVDGVRVVTFKSSVTNRVDVKALREHEPEIAATYTAPSATRTMRFPNLPKES
jgi:putative phage-type endonuclease